MPFGTYPRCDTCKHAVTQVIDRIIKGKRVTKCFSCARKAGWFEDEPVQGQLFKE